MDKAYQAIEKLDVPEESQEIHEEFLVDFIRQTIDQLNQKIDEIIEDHQEYGTALAEIMKSLKSSAPAKQAPKINQVAVQNEYLKEFEVDFGQFDSFNKAKDAAYKKDAVTSSELFQELIGEIADQPPLKQKFIAMYSSIIKELPTFQKVLSDNQVFYEFAPVQLQNTVSALFKQLKKHAAGSGSQKKPDVEEIKEDIMKSRQQDGASSQIILDLLREIFNEDANYNDMLCQYLLEQSAFSEEVRAARREIKTLKMLRQENLVKAHSQITSNERDLQNISDFMTVNIDIDFQAIQTSLCNWFRDGKILFGDTTTQLLYDLIKKRCNFGKFITQLSNNSKGSSEEVLFSQQFFLTYLLNNSDTYLRTMILTVCSNFMPLPLVTYQPKQQKNIPLQANYHESKSGAGKINAAQEQNQDMTGVSQKQIEFTPHVYEELFYCYEKYKAVLAFKVSANPNKSPQGCTSLTNYVFNRSFQTHSDSLVNYGSIDIQFDYNFEHPMFVPVADAHGLVEDEILENVYPLFNIFMIHTLSGLEHQQVANNQITKISQIIKNPLIFLIIHDERRKVNDFTSKTNGNIVQITLRRYNELLESPLENLRILILEKFKQYIVDSKNYEQDIPARLQSLQEFSVFTQKFRALKNKLNEMDEDNQEAYGQSQDQIKLEDGLATIRNFMKLIDDNKEHLRTDKVLKMNVLFEEACRLEKQLLRDTSLTKDKTEEFRNRVAKLYMEMRKSEPSPFTEELRKIVDLQNYVGLTSIISKFIRSFLNLHLKPLLQEREKLRTEFQKLKVDETVKDEINQKIKDQKDQMLQRISDLTKTVEQRYYSNEFLYREYYISELSQLKGTNKPPSQSFNDYLSLCNLQISQGQPFEIIDGNNLQFIKEVYQRIQDGGGQDQEILVVSIIGPQSSGKSLLLNTLFGAQFLSSAGRCTRGVYGCLIDINSDMNRTRFKKILILDSEGIQSTEAVDEAFDKRVVFYILCVSHVVLICNKGEMNKNMEDTIKLATDCMMQVRQKIDQQPQVNVIMNNVQINENSLYQTIQSLSNCLLEMRRNDGQRQIFTIDQSNVFLLPNAFAQSGNEGFVAYQPSYQFAEKVDKLRQTILKFMQGGITPDIASYTLESWFKFAQQFWEFTDGYSGLTDYSTLEERKEDIALGEFTKQLIADHFEDEKMIEKHNEMIQKGVKLVLDQHQGFDQTHINEIKKKIDSNLYHGTQEVEQKIYDEYRKFTDDKGIRAQIKKRRGGQLDTQMKQHFFNWQQIVQKHLMEFNENKSRLIGDKSLQNAIDRYIKDDKKQYTIEDSEIIFQKEWMLIVQQMIKTLKTTEQIYDDQITDIGQNLYRQNFRTMVDVEGDRQLLSSYEGLQSKNILNHLKEKKEFFYFQTRTLKLSSQQFKTMIERKKHFFNNKDLKFYDENNAQRYYNWKKIVEERFNYLAVYKAFTEIPKTNILDKIKNVFYYTDKKVITQLYIERVKADIQDEANQLNIDITEQFTAFLHDLAQKCNDGIGYEAIKKQINDTIKENIKYFFVYKKRESKIRSTQQMQYFIFSSFWHPVLNKKIQTYSWDNYIVLLDPQDSKLQKGGLEPIVKCQMYFTVNEDLKLVDEKFSQYLTFLVRSDESMISSSSPEVESAVKTFYSLVDHEKVMETIQKIVLENIFRKKDQIKYKAVEKLVNDLIESNDPNFTQEFCAIDFKVVQRIANSIEEIVNNINEDIEPYWLAVSEHGRDCLHQIAQTYIVRIMQEVIRLTEHAPLYTLIKSENVQRDLFIAKLTSNDIQIDVKLAERTRKHLMPIIIKGLKQDQIKQFQMKINQEQELFKLNTIVSNIEEHVVKIADKDKPDQFQIDTQPGGGDGWYSRWVKSKIGQLQGNQEEEKMQSNKGIISRFKKMQGEFDFTPEQIIMFYVKPRDFLQRKFKDQWKKSTDLEIQKTKQNYAKNINNVKSNFKNYFETLKMKLQEKNIQLSTNVFIPEGQEKHSQEYLSSKTFRVHCQKAMAMYMGLVLNKQWKDGTVLELDDNSKMINPPNITLVKHGDIGIDIDARYVGYIQDVIHKDQISNIENFIDALLSELEINLSPEQQPENSLTENDLIGNLYQEMLNKTLGCKEMCPLCRRQCDQVHDEQIPDLQVHRCDSGHQIQGFGGNMHKKDNNAIVLGCNELDDKDIVVYQGTEKKWENFKSDLRASRKWDFADKGGAKENDKLRNAKIWNKIGQFICEYYRAVDNINIKFVEADATPNKKRKISKVHYILMLDNSWSMDDRDKNGNSCWQNLSSAVSSFLNKFDASLQTYSAVSIITYNHIAKIDQEAKIPTPALVSGLTGPCGGTDFNPPLNTAKELMDKYEKSYDSFVLIMMSDGGASHPSEGINNINNSTARGKLAFKSIAYGEGSDTGTLKRMADELGGTLEKVLAPGQLSSAFIQMIPNVFDQK